MVRCIRCESRPFAAIAQGLIDAVTGLVPRGRATQTGLGLRKCFTQSITGAIVAAACNADETRCAIGVSTSIVFRNLGIWTQFPGEARWVRRIFRIMDRLRAGRRDQVVGGDADLDPVLQGENDISLPRRNVRLGFP